MRRTLTIARWCAVGAWAFVLVAVSIAWLLSVLRADSIRRQEEYATGLSQLDRRLLIESADGMLLVSWESWSGSSGFSLTRWTMGPKGAVSWKHERSSVSNVMPDDTTWWSRRGWIWRWNSSQYSWSSHRSILIRSPYWLLDLLLIAPAFIAWRVWKHLRRGAARSAAGLCAKCGYDLRASSERCPECGNEISSHVGAEAVVALTDRATEKHV